MLPCCTSDLKRRHINPHSVYDLPSASDLKPRISATVGVPLQPFRLVFWGEKSSLNSVLNPKSEQYHADLYLQSGDISNTWLAEMARIGAADSREMIVFIFADCDPSGYGMATTIAHKLRALKESLYPRLQFRILTPALTVEQANELDLPDSPLKETERRAEGWRAKYGREQTEIDALATLRPDVLRRIVDEAVGPFFDATLGSRVNAAKYEWDAEAQRRLDAALDNDHVAEIQARAIEHIEALQAELDALEAAVEEANIDLPPFIAPEPILNGEPDLPLVSSDMPLLDHIVILKHRKGTPFQIRSATGQHRRDGGVSGGGKGRGQGL